MSNKTDKQVFIEACLSENLQTYYAQYIAERPTREAAFSKENGVLVHKQWRPSPRCTVTGGRLTSTNIDVIAGYWTPHLWKPVRKDLRASAMKEEAYQCQLLDTSCNDCKHLVRADGKCGKFDTPVYLGVNESCPQNAKCFEHRLG